MSDPDFWGWVERNRGEIWRPIVGFAISRTQFPPNPGHPGISFSRYDPVEPRRPPLTPVVPGGDSKTFRFDTPGAESDYNIWGGWNEAKSLTLIGLTGSFIAKMDTTSEDLSTWTPDPLVYNITSPSVSALRFIPRTNHAAFVGSDGFTTNLYQLNTNTMTISLLYTNLQSYAYSFDGEKIAMKLPAFGVGVRVFNRDGNGAPTTELTTGPVFDFTPTEYEFTDDGKYLVAWDYQKLCVYLADPPFTKEYEHPQTTQLPGLFGPQTAYLMDAWIHPRFEYFAWSLRVYRGLDADAVRTEVRTRDGVIVATAGTGEAEQRGEWSQSGDIWLGGDGGRDPYGGDEQIMKIDGFVVATRTAQETYDYRIRPFH